jgi:N-acetylglucosamine-6-sulfatase
MIAALVLITAVVGGRLVAGETAQASPTEPLAADSPPAAAAVAAPLPPEGERSAIRNVVLVLADDLDTATFNQVSRLRALRQEGLSLRSMVVTESLCCPSRASILRGQYVHNHGVLSNLGVSQGGWLTFAQKGEEADCLPVWLKAAGVQTAYVGKYLNGYGEDGDPTAVPPGWDYWFAPTTKSGMYRGYGYTVNDNTNLRSYAAGKDDFLPDVITEQAVNFLRTARSPFYLQVNSTSPHDPAPVAARHRDSNRNDRIPRTRTFNNPGIDAPPWRAKRAALSPEKIARYDAYWRKRVRSTESIADTVDAVVAELRRSGQLGSTLIVVTSDNGLHAGQRRLPAGKRTPYREDTVVPTVLIGPGITPGSSTRAITSTIDLAPTVAELLGAQVPTWADGRSLVPLLSSPESATWRTGVVTESLGDTAFNDPDFAAFKPPNYHALRTQHWLYVEYETGARELFDLAADPQETTNIISGASPGLLNDLGARLAALSACSGDTCREADTWTGTPSQSE